MRALLAAGRGDARAAGPKRRRGGGEARPLQPGTNSLRKATIVRGTFALNVDSMEKAAADCLHWNEKLKVGSSVVANLGTGLVAAAFGRWFLTGLDA